MQVLHGLADWQCSWGQPDQAEAACQPEILQELPEVLQSLAFPEPPEIREAPELVEQQRRYRAEPAKGCRRRAVMFSGDDARWRGALHGDRSQQRSDTTRRVRRR
ncbi:MAG TPA: hypothetical protein VFA39_09275 [Steroidobacteraceae bacterium]|nr:hypothetical protein [Steroidobacteraceae bacterium]